ncbi:MAG: hypothetical protein ACQESN_11075 [Thermotogota bacterium]
MITDLNTLKNNLITHFDAVSINDDTVLKQKNTATLYLEEVSLERETFHRRNKSETIAIIFNVKENNETAYNLADKKIEEIINVLDTTFDDFFISSIKFAYVNQQKLLFVEMKITKNS